MKSEISRFLVVGGLNFGLTFLVFTTMLKVLNVGYIAALLTAWFTGNILTYTLNFVWVFRPNELLSFRGRFFKYLTAGAFSIGLNLLTLSVLVEFKEWDPFWAQVVIMPFIVVFNYMTAKFWSLRKEKAK